MIDFNEYHSRIRHLCGIEWSAATIAHRSEKIERYAAQAYANGCRAEVAAKNLLRGMAYQRIPLTMLPYDGDQGEFT